MRISTNLPAAMATASRAAPEPTCPRPEVEARVG